MIELHTQAAACNRNHRQKLEKRELIHIDRLSHISASGDIENFTKIKEIKNKKTQT